MSNPTVILVRDYNGSNASRESFIDDHVEMALSNAVALEAAVSAFRTALQAMHDSPVTLCDAGSISDIEGILDTMAPHYRETIEQRAIEAAFDDWYA